MKNLHSFVTGILAVCVAVLFYLNLKHPAAPASSDALPVPAIPIASNIVYVNSDSLLDNYAYFKTKKAEFESKHKQIQSELKSESDRLQRDAETYQQAATTLGDRERQTKEEELMKRQEALMKKKDDMLDAFDQEQNKFNEELYNKLGTFLREFNKGKNYTFILGYQKGGGILFANDSLDITRQVLAGLNKEYEEKK